MWKQITFILAVYLKIAVTARLGSYNIDSSKVSVSGISSGAAMATQLHVALSSKIMGAGIIAGVPYMCARGNSQLSGECMVVPGPVNVAKLSELTDAAALVGNIDPTSNLGDSKVYIFAGSKDSLIKPSAGMKVEYFYNFYISDTSNIKTVYDIEAENGMPTLNYGGDCEKINTETYINNCGYSAAFDLLNHIYGGGLTQPSSKAVASGQLLTYTQGDFYRFVKPVYYSLDKIGYVYVPTNCKDSSKKCKLHIALHGCGQQRGRIGDVYVKNAGYNEVADLNDIIILYPQAAVNFVNPNGCWDWHGYTGVGYATKAGGQIVAIRRMIERIIARHNVKSFNEDFEPLQLHAS